MPPKYRTRKNEFQYGMPLYGCAYPAGSHYFVCGGGGHGLKPRIVWAQYVDGRCTDQTGDFELGEATPMRMAVAPSGSALLLANATGGLRRFQLDMRAENPRVIEVTAAFSGRLQQLSEEINAMAFSEDGRRLAVGFETKKIKIVEYPSMSMMSELSTPAAVKDIAFWARPGAPRVMAATLDNGECYIYDADTGAQLCQLQPPKGMERAKFTKVRFGRNGDDILFAGINQGVQASYLAAFTPDEQLQGSWRLLHKVKVDDGPNSCVEVSKSGAMVAMGQTSGKLLAFNASTLQLIKQEKEANQVFITAITFSEDELRLMAVGGDANCYVMDLEQKKKPRGSGLGSFITAASILVVLLAGAAAVLDQPQLLAPLGKPAVAAAAAAADWLHEPLNAVRTAAADLLSVVAGHPLITDTTAATAKLVEAAAGHPLITAATARTAELVTTATASTAELLQAASGHPLVTAATDATVELVSTATASTAELLEVVSGHPLGQAAKAAAIAAGNATAAAASSALQYIRDEL